MPTNTDMIRALQVELAETRAKVESLEAIDLRLSKLTDEFNQQAREFAAIKQSLSGLEKQVDRLVTQRFTIAIAIASAIFGSALTFASQFMIRLLTK
jgi:archaellum component FlaC